MDLVVFSAGDLQAARRACAEAALDTSLETGESVEPLVYPLTRYYHPDSLFLQQAVKQGKVIYAMEEPDLKRSLLEGRYHLASSYLRVARYVFDHGDYREAADLAYNAAETAVKALLLLEIEELPKSHRGVVNRFGDLYIRTGRLPRSMGRDLRLALATRNRARYEPEQVITRPEAEEVLGLADRLLQHVMEFRQALSE